MINWFENISGNCFPGSYMSFHLFSLPSTVVLILSYTSHLLLLDTEFIKGDKHYIDQWFISFTTKTLDIMEGGGGGQVQGAQCSEY